MKRSITLYIGGRRADLDDDRLVLMNYAIADLANPTVLRNTYSQAVQLPRTPDNDRIFGDAGRVDRLAGAGGSGADFNASQKTPFAIYDSAGGILVSGYAKLTAVTRDYYSVTLFGGLGSLMYALSYDEDGNKRTLASLDYLGNGDTDELDFTITADTVREAWARLRGDSTKPAKWDVINFAPCYNGIPSNFSADKAIAQPADVGLSPTQTKDGTSYGLQGNTYCPVTLPESVDEWAAKDLRSYLQRPVLKVWKLLQAMARPANNGGWTIDLSAINNLLVWPYMGAWITRPLLPALGTFRRTTGSASMTPSGVGTFTATTQVARFAVSGVPSGAEVTADMTVRLRYRLPNGDHDALYPYLRTGLGNSQQVLFVQAIAYASDNSKVAASPTVPVYYDTDRISGLDMADACNYTPDSLNTTILAAVKETPYNRVGETTSYDRAETLQLSLTGTYVARIDIIVKAYTVVVTAGGHVYSVSGGNAPYTQLYTHANDLYLTPTGATFATANGSASYDTGDQLRSGARITKEMLLSTEGTPADYLLAILRTFGFYLLADADTKTAAIVPRSQLYQNETIDLSDRIDSGEDVEIQPLAFDARWYDFRVPSVGGAFADQYKAAEGQEYGAQRVNTNYGFDANAKDVLDGIVLKSCAAVLDASKYWAYAMNNGVFTPAPFLYSGASYTLWKSDGGGENFSVPVVTSGIEQYNGSYLWQDVAPFGRAEFRDAEGKPLDGADCLLITSGSTLMPHMQITDDLPVMATLGGGQPCWILGSGADEYIPHFERVYYDSFAGQIRATLDMGAPRQTAVPNVTYPIGKTIYELFWKDYIHDRLSVNNKVIRCRVRFDGLQVGLSLLRKFYWWRGSLWVISSISNYSLTTFDLAEVELVQVQDKANY